MTDKLSDNVRYLPTATLPPDQLFEQALNHVDPEELVIVVGYDREQGAMFVLTSKTYIPDIVFLLEQAKMFILAEPD